MGWYYGASSRKQLVEEVTEGNETDTHKQECIRKCFRGWRDLWTVWEDTNKLTGEQKRFIVLFMIGGGGDDWGYKAVEESMGPYQLSCPLSYLDLSTIADDGYASDWHKRVREAAAARRGAK